MKHRRMAKKFKVLLVALLTVVMIPVTATTAYAQDPGCLLYTSPSPRDQRGSRMPSSA